MTFDPMAHRLHKYILGLFFLLLLASPVRASDLPRFVSTRSDEVNMRVGPGERYPIRWVYRRAGLPLKVIDEYGHWREVEDWDGETGWMHKSLLSGKRTAMIVGGTRALHRKPDATEAAALKAEATVTGEILRCAPAWCQMSVRGRRGWIPKEALWGVFAEETFDD